MCKNEDGNIRYAPLCIQSFKFIAPRKLLEAQLFHKKYRKYQSAIVLHIAVWKGGEYTHLYIDI